MKRKEVMNRIQEIYAKLDKDRLDLSEIEELVDLSNNLYERALILRYKVAEQRIFGKEHEATMTEIANETDELSEVAMEDSGMTESIDFSIFESVEEKVLDENEALLEHVPQEVVHNPKSEELNFADLPEKPATEIDVRIEPSDAGNEALVAEEKAELPLATNVAVIDDVKNEPNQKIATDTNAEINTETIPNSATENDWLPYFDKVLADHSTSIQKAIDTLAGSFGLNERILYINELFNADADKFSNAVLKIDKSENWVATKTVMNDLANTENWDKESDTVVEFVLHVKRKHA